jgi:hypothetical protein
MHLNIRYALENIWFFGFFSFFSCLSDICSAAFHSTSIHHTHVCSYTDSLYCAFIQFSFVAPSFFLPFFVFRSLSALILPQSTLAVPNSSLFSGCSSCPLFHRPQMNPHTTIQHPFETRFIILSLFSRSCSTWVQLNPPLIKRIFVGVKRIHANQLNMESGSGATNERLGKQIV